ncbi:monovalent cation/H(+) antiporter subunit G [Chelatococcus asaccharovorans]|uniref:Multisubunit potassium/proton antiporter PhaG subunit n=1 Tax=Chelatococcus asaccharovorans TaxID=28210 RepID=A0A2V3UH92_9HYPH|nr:monovalent cation/H(+) antiporter subunit G [Chelatococcus asaccharovorans]MBS7701804.1 monovalent cation/H(+) antiporter subunit G [Chelatococcus asaccharovorans]PXW64489.1 multisubunit potassium/proton antiporter PhaG subunit [Chelatococcus asaccharovorans]CAH1665597.1 putative K(+)/H(+) antiporter subunit G [Chelatococcus asaccharovorans]CAH1681876.1 putative K(+)/H(+) antiporter subunit G [Chelatococcus asaccharovorans]
MNNLAALPAWAALITAFLVLLGAGLALIGNIGLIRFASFYERVHAPTLGATLGMLSILAASIVCFSALQTRPVVHEILIGVFVTVTTPVTLMLLVQATLYRDRLEEKDPLEKRAAGDTAA